MKNLLEAVTWVSSLVIVRLFSNWVEEDEADLS